MKNIIFGIFILASAQVAFGQSDKLSVAFDDPISFDSTSAVMIPTRYNSDLLSGKMAFWNNCYANILFYDLKNGASHKLFEKDTYIIEFPGNSAEKRSSTNRIFYLVMSNDFNKNGRIDNEDPAILYASDKSGMNLQSITPENENVMDIRIYNDKGYALIKMQRDKNGNGNFSSNDKDYYYLSMNLSDLTLSKPIDID